VNNKLLYNIIVFQQSMSVLGDENVVINVPTVFHATPAEVQANAPELGEHTDEILSSIVGLDEEDIVTLRTKGITKPILGLPFELPAMKSRASKL